MSVHGLIANAIDAHVHSGPDVFSRRLDDRELVRNAQRWRMEGVVLKNHLFPTAARARLAGVDTPVRVWGGIALNLSVGGWNPWAVRACREMGGKIVWMPTAHARHLSLRRETGSMFGPVMVSPQEALSPLDENGELLPQVHEILQLIASGDMVLATGHLSPDESAVVVREAVRCGVRRIWLTHPFATIVACSLQQVQDILSVAPYAWVEFTANDCSASQTKPLPLAQVAEWIRALGSQRVILTSDGGQSHNPPPHEMLSSMLDGLVAEGLTKSAVRQMVVDNPLALLT